MLDAIDEVTNPDTLLPSTFTAINAGDAHLSSPLILLPSNSLLELPTVLVRIQGERRRKYVGSPGAYPLSWRLACEVLQPWRSSDHGVYGKQDDYVLDRNRTKPVQVEAINESPAPIQLDPTN
jgi:hypothetical protein